MSSALSGVTALLAAGGTGGHLQPALAVAAEAQARGADVVVVTTPSQMERVAAEYRTFAVELQGLLPASGAAGARAHGVAAGRRRA